ncbi:MAG: benzoate transporter [Actinobacteria bacterium]|nr:benzoate transporter [Actinomycetota bacterium]
MKELRIKNKNRLFRILFIFDPERKAVLLNGGDKCGDRNFYDKMISLADDLYDKYLSLRNVP